MDKRVLLVLPLLSGCSALQTKEEQTWQALHLIDAAQTYQISQNPLCYEEGAPLTRAVIGKSPKPGAVAGWWATRAVAHALVTDYLLEDHPKVAKWWSYISIGFEASTVGSNFSIGVNVGSSKKCANSQPVREPEPTYQRPIG